MLKKFKFWNLSNSKYKKIPRLDSITIIEINNIINKISLILYLIKIKKKVKIIKVSIIIKNLIKLL